MRGLAAGVLLAALTCLALSGCGGGEQSPTTEPTVAEQSVSLEQEGEGAAGLSASKGHGEENQADPPTATDVPSDPVRSTGIPKAPKGGDDSIQTYGEGADAATTNEIAGTMNAYFAARLAGEWKRACDYTSPDRTAPFESQDASCPEVIEGLTANVGRSRLDRPATTIGGVRSEGEHAFVIFKGRGGKWMVMALQRDDGRWGVLSAGANQLFY